jgi:hypothetical protein
MRAWIEPNDDPTYMTTIEIVEDNNVIQSTSYISRPLQWTIENLTPPDYTE